MRASRFHGWLFRRYGPRRRLFQGLFIIFVLFTFVEILYVRHRLQTVDDLEQIQSVHTSERIYIASIHWNNEPILRSHWNEAVIQLAKTWGPKNIFVSVLESGSWDDTKGALHMLDVELGKIGVSRNITLSEITHQDEILRSPSEDGWIETPRGQLELRRIPYLSQLRNKALRPLLELAQEGIFFDKILFLNDVVFTVKDVVTLLQTNDGIYAAACSLDFSKPPLYYDTFALRDYQGEEHVMQTWPYFRSAESRNALYRMSPVPVKSCWNGMVAMPSEPFLADTPLEFRGVSDSLALSHLEASECCLIHADNHLSKTLGVYLNPRVRVGYNSQAYAAVHPAISWISSWQIAVGLWENRLQRLLTTSLFKRLMVKRRLEKWEKEFHQHEPGDFCLINEMQVLVANGWAHV